MIGQPKQPWEILALFKAKTAFVIGAGASKELGLPLGGELKQHITNLLQPTTDNMYGFKEEATQEIIKSRFGLDAMYKGDEITAIKKAAAQIVTGLRTSPSVDNLLYTHDGDGEIEQLGKATIAISILRAERQSHLFTPRRDGYDRAGRVQWQLGLDKAELTKSWYYPLAERLFTLVSRHDIASAFRNVQFIIFNYDRCLEQFLYLVVQSHFGVGPDEAAEVLRTVSFLHPYGSLGSLPWQRDGETTKLKLGDDEGVNYWSIAKNIQTFTESADTGIRDRARRMLAESETLIFLGFGFLEQNERLLRPPANKVARRAFATVCGIHPDEHALIKLKLRRFCADPGATDTFLETGECRALFPHYQYHLEEN